MPRTTVEDRWGGRWTVRARYERHAVPGCRHARRLAAAALQSRLPAMLAPLGPAATAHSGQCHSIAPPRAVTDDHSDPAAARYATELARMRVTGGGVVGGILGVLRGIRALTLPSDRYWVVELVARGRLRRGATWQVAGRDEGMQAAAAVVDAVRSGLVPAPDGALLIDVVDHRLTVHGVPR